MGPQQILFLILGFCIIGIAASAGVIVLQSDGNIDYRQAIYADLKRLASEAQAYRNRAFEENGGDGTFIGLTSTPQGMARLSKISSSPYAEFLISKNGNANSVELIAVGYSPGNNPRKPLEMLMTVFADSTAITVLN